MKFQEEGEGSNPFLIKLKDKGSIYGVLQGDLKEFRTHWNGSRSSNCPGDTCPLCAQNQKAKFRFQVNMVVKENGAWVAKVLEQGWKVYEQLRNINKENPIDTQLLKITRTGSGQNDTSYFVMPAKAVPPEEMVAIRAVKLIDLNASPQEQKQSAGPEVSDSREDDIPF